MIEIRIDRRRDIDDYTVAIHIENTKTNRSAHQLTRCFDGQVPAWMVESILRHFVRVGEIPA
jgi:hypothetical protein